MIKDKGRAGAAKIALRLHLGRTMIAIQDGKRSPEEVRSIAREEFLDAHKDCLCCKGSAWAASLWAEEIYKRLTVS